MTCSPTSSKASRTGACLPVDTPASLRVCVRRCLQKDPAKRLHHVADVRLALEGAFESAPPGRGRTTRQHRPLCCPSRVAGWAVAALVVIVATIAVVMLLRAGLRRQRLSRRRHPVLVRPKIGGGGAATTKTIQEAIDLAVRGATVSVLPEPTPKRSPSARTDTSKPPAGEAAQSSWRRQARRRRDRNRHDGPGDHSRHHHSRPGKARDSRRWRRRSHGGGIHGSRGESATRSECTDPGQQ